MKEDGLFNVTMGTHNGPEICALVGTFLLDKISVKYNKNSIGLYRDHGCQSLKTQLDRIRKSL